LWPWTRTRASPLARERERVPEFTRARSSIRLRTTIVFGDTLSLVLFGVLVCFHKVTCILTSYRYVYRPTRSTLFESVGTSLVGIPSSPPFFPNTPTKCVGVAGPPPRVKFPGTLERLRTRLMSVLPLPPPLANKVIPYPGGGWLATNVESCQTETVSLKSPDTGASVSGRYVVSDRLRENQNTMRRKTRGRNRKALSFLPRYRAHTLRLFSMPPNLVNTENNNNNNITTRIVD
jgi:hypothetical protein